ncbi:origin recognition complex subunit 3 N-terminus-domain-containing protein [Ganoderma leucocontextum]|nr:origin recognition complex subunit 3 N-terminus-domain-containing protein [Ganoderma leucocontextum]
MKELEDPSKTCVYIPPSQPDAGNALPSRFEDEEEDECYDSQMRAYRAAWMKCLDRIRTILETLHAPVVSDITEQVKNAYTDVLPGLPYPELPVVALSGATSALLAEVINALSEDEDTEEGADEPPSLQVHLYPAECSSVMNTMKAIVTGFVDRRESGKRKPTSLASFDINLLRAWYNAQEMQSHLIVFLHEFEKFDSNVVQDVLYICSMHIPRLPLVFILVMNSPPSPSFIHTVYPRSTLALLRVHQVAPPAGLLMAKEVLSKTLFDPDFEPDVMLGPGALDHIADFASRHSASPDALITMLQLAYMKHFSNPLSIFVDDELIGTTPHDARRALMSSAGFAPVVDAAHARLLAASESQSQGDEDGRPQTADELLSAVSAARTEFRRQARRLRIAFTVARIAERVALSDATHGLVNGKNVEGRAARLDSLEALSAILRQRGSSQVRYVCMAVRKLSAIKLRALLQELHAFWYGLESAVIRREEEGARIWIVEMLNQLPGELEEEPADGPPPPQDAQTKELAGSVGDWLQEYIEQRLVRLEDCTLWDIWYTGATPFPSELVNPAPRPTVVQALLHPDDFMRAYAGLAHGPGQPASTLDVVKEPVLWELPDTSIAFRRYGEAGRMVNVFDWFESFAVVLDSQRRHLKRASVVADEDMDAEADEDVDADADEEMDVGEEEERWKIEVQARFMRALHELDYMGFVRHTGRKADHVIRTFYDVPD